MSWNPENFSDYSFSEYAQPFQSEKVDYTDPHFYQTTPAPISQPTQPEMTQNNPPDVTMKRKIWLFSLASVTAVVSIIVYAQMFSLAFGIGIVVLLFIHEMGHAMVMKLKGIPIGGMIFVPMLGAAVIMRRMPGNAKDEAEVGIAGPIAGALASLVCLFIALAHPGEFGFSNVWASLAYFGFFLNLFNLVPIVPFDGGRVVAAIDRRVWLIGFIGLLAIQIWQLLSHNFSIWLPIFVILAGVQLVVRWRGPKTPEKQAYYAQSRGERIIIGLAYFTLIAFLVLGMTASHSLMAFF
jgi:Zn-dependent protease